MRQKFQAKTHNKFVKVDLNPVGRPSSTGKTKFSTGAADSNSKNKEEGYAGYISTFPGSNLSGTPQIPATPFVTITTWAF